MSEFVEHGLLGVIEDPFGGVLCLGVCILFDFFVEIRLPSMIPALGASVAGMVAGSFLKSELKN